MRWFALLLIFCVCTRLAAQDPIPDTTEVWRYFPLEIGNVWEYRQFDPSSFPEYLIRTSIQRDTLVGETHYFLYDRTVYDVSGSVLSDREYPIRFDSLSAQAVRLDQGVEERYAPIVCSFDVPFPPPEKPFQCGPDTFDQVLSGGYNNILNIGYDTVVTAVKTYAVIYFGRRSYAADFGYIGESGCEGGCWDWRLTYAKIGEEEYGEPNPVAAEPEIPDRPGFALLAAYPNPSSDRFLISLLSSKLQQITVDVFDLLGRRVYSEQRVAVAGQTTLHLDGSNWPRGLYLIRVTTEEGQTSTTGLTHQ